MNQGEYELFEEMANLAYSAGLPTEAGPLKIIKYAGYVTAYNNFTSVDVRLVRGKLVVYGDKALFSKNRAEIMNSQEWQDYLGGLK